MRHLTLDAAWAMLRDDERAVLVDVRTPEEWNLVGVPTVDSLGKTVRFVTWTPYGGGDRNPVFLDSVGEGVDTDAPVLVLCRSGVRSLAAGGYLAANGYQNLFNVDAGFEGDVDDHGHRTTGWRHQGLPWRQG